MFTAFSTALSGLNAMTDAIDVVGNNLANLNTTGYKNVSVSFHELISQALGGTASSQVGLGTERPDSTANYIQGAIQNTGGQYDEAIQGDGFFVVKNTGGQTLYSRDGGFAVNSNGYLVTKGGEYVQGWTGTSNGTVNTNGTLGDIQVPTGTVSQPVATSAFSIAANLDSSSTPVVPLLATGSATGSIALTGARNTLSLGINGAVAQTFTLNTADTTVTAVATDLQAQFTAAGINATASVNASGGLKISSTLSTPSAGVQVYNGTGDTPLGLATTPVPLSVTGSATSSIALTAANNTLSLGLNSAAARTFTLNTTDTTVTAAAADLQAQFTALSISANASVSASGGLLISSTLSTPSAGVQVYNGTSNTPLGLTSTVPLLATGSATGSIGLTANNTLSLGINGAAAQTFTLNTADTTVAAAAADLQTQFTNAGINATTSVNASGGLQISSTLSTPNAGVQVYNGTGNIPLGLTNTSTATSSTNTYSTGQVEVVDSLGNKIPLTLSFTKDTTNGTWSYSVSAPQGVVSGGTGAVQFDSSGNMTGISSSTISSDGKSDKITISNLSDGAANLSMNWSFYNTDGTPKFTQYSEASGVSANMQNGQVASELTSVSLGSGGQVLAQFASGPQEVVGVLAMATLRNPTSLLGATNNNLALGAGSATPAIGTAGTGGRGTLEGGSLESSTVDIASEFSNLLTYERSYQANSRVITVSDTISQETVNLIK